MTTSTMQLVQEAKANIKEVSIELAKQMITGNSKIIDVREALEFETGHVPNAIHISRGLLEFMIPNHPECQDKNQSFIVYCKSGGRSALATATLQQLGYQNVHSMLGGFDEWSAGSAIPEETKA